MTSKSSLFVMLLIMSILAVVMAAPLRTVSLTRRFSQQEKQDLFSQFTQEHNKRYADDAEREKRFKIFGENLDYAVQVQQAAQIRGDALTTGITKFFDLTPQEFKERNRRGFKGYAVSAGIQGKPIAHYRRKNAAAAALPQSFDWRTAPDGKKAVTSVKNQGSCGSCWAFSTVGNVEGVWALSNGTLVDLAPQHLVDCDKTCTQDPKHGKLCDEGCNGGFQSNALPWIVQNGGIATERSYPYKARNGKCKASSDYVVGAKLSGWERLNSNETQIAEYLVDNGPLAVALDASPLQWYSSGIISSGCKNSFDDLDHAVLLVGFGEEKNTPYWIVKNSWASDWGEHGYFRIKRSYDNKPGVCGINVDVVSGKV